MSVTGILGKKIGMTQLFDDRGEVHPVTVLQAGPCVVTQLKTLAGDGYSAAQIGLIEFVKGGKVNKPMAGHFAKTNVPPVKLMREVPIEQVTDSPGSRELKAGDHPLVDLRRNASMLIVIGTSKGRGPAGVVPFPSLRWWPKNARAHVPGAGLDWCYLVSLARSTYRAAAMPGILAPTDLVRAICPRAGISLDDDFALMVEGAVLHSSRGLRHDLQVQGSTAGASRLWRRRHGRSIEGFEREALALSSWALEEIGRTQRSSPKCQLM